MKHLRQIICILAIVLFAVGSMAFTVHTVQAAAPQTKCPVMGYPINKNIYVDYEGKRIYFCCKECPQEFKKDPEKYMKKLNEEGVTLEAAPRANKTKE